MKGTEKKLTSVKLDPEGFDDFKMNSIRYKFSFQKLAERAVYLYNTDKEFRKMIHGIKPEFGEAE